VLHTYFFIVVWLELLGSVSLRFVKELWELILNQLPSFGQMIKSLKL
jgi:hypothetical protein